MSYKDYSVEAVKEIMTKVSESQRNHHASDLNRLSLIEGKPIEENSGLNSSRTQKKVDYEYNRPTTAESNRVNETHIFIEKWFECDLPEDVMWEEIETKLEETYADGDTSGKVKYSSTKKKWIYKNHSNYEMVLTLKKSNRFANIKVSKRVGFWGANIDGILHGSYTSLIFSGLIYILYQPSLQLSIGMFSLLWILNAVIIYKFSLSLRKKKHEQLTNFTDTLVESFTLHDKQHHLSNTGTESGTH